MKAHHVLNAGAPVDCDRLRLLKFRYFGFDGKVHNNGEIVIMDAAADHVRRIFTSLENNRFPVAKAVLMNHYDGNDDASMADNNTSGFNHREIASGGSISLHSYGLAIDLNPLQNPYIKRTGDKFGVSPPHGVEYLNRLNDRPWRADRPGMTEAIVDVFADHGFPIWGGYWDDPIDYQHFQVSRKLADQLVRLPSADAQALFERHLQHYLACRRAVARRGGSARSSCIMSNDQIDNLELR